MSLLMIIANKIYYYYCYYYYYYMYSKALILSSIHSIFNQTRSPTQLNITLIIIADTI